MSPNTGSRLELARGFLFAFACPGGRRGEGTDSITRQLRYA